MGVTSSATNRAHRLAEVDVLGLEQGPLHALILPDGLAGSGPRSFT